MKKVLVIIIVVYLVLLVGIFYVYFGPGMFSDYKVLKWKGLETNVPSGVEEVKTFRKNDWDVYSMKESTVMIKIALKPGAAVSRIPGYYPNVLYRVSPGPGEIYFVANPGENYEVVFAKAMADGMTLQFIVVSHSAHASRYIMDKVVGNCFYRGQKVTLPEYAIPLKCYVEDYTILGAYSLPLIIIILYFYFSGKKPSSRYFEGDPIRFEESFVYCKHLPKSRGRFNFCYLVLTSTRLMVFHFMKPKWETRVREENADITIDGKWMYLQGENGIVVLKPSKIEEWQEVLGLFSQ